MTRFVSIFDHSTPFLIPKSLARRNGLTIDLTAPPYTDNPMARQRPLPALPRHVSRTLSKRPTVAFGLRSMSTETPTLEEKDDSTASAEEKAKTGTPPVS
jgi:hypothetical protein